MAEQDGLPTGLSEEQEIAWTRIVDTCADERYLRINVGSAIRRATIIKIDRTAKAEPLIRQDERAKVLKEVGRILRQHDRCSPDVKDFELRILPLIEIFERGKMPGEIKKEG